MTKPNPMFGEGVPYRTYAAIARLMRNEGWVLMESSVSSSRVSFVFKRHGLTIENVGSPGSEEKTWAETFKEIRREAKRKKED